MEAQSGKATLRLDLDNHNNGGCLYHLHRTILAAGPCKSDYFAALFKTPMRETTTNTSTIEMAKDAADAVPLMLDFMYTQELGIITCELAVTLRFLAE